MMLYFIVFKHKKDKEYKLFTNIVFDKENEVYFRKIENKDYSVNHNP